MPTYKQVPLDKLVVDKRYQRELTDSRVDQIVNNFDANLLDPISVSERNGKYAVYDGQTRTAAFKKMGRKTIPAIVRTNLTPAQEANLFVEQRRRANIKPLDRFRGQLFAGHEEAVELEATVRDAGFSIGYRGSRVIDGKTISAVAKLETSAEQYGYENLKEALTLMGEIWSGDASIVDGALIQGITRFYKDYSHRLGGSHRKSKYQTKMDALRDVTASEVIRSAKSRHLESNGGNSLQRSIYAELRRITNMAGRPAKTAEWQKGGRKSRQEKV